MNNMNELTNDGFNMKNIFRSIKLDHLILRKNYKALILLYVIGIFVGVTTKMPGSTVTIILLVTAPFVGMYFSIYEKNNLNKLYGILPLGKAETVIGRYIFALIFGIVNSIVSIALSYVIAFITGQSNDQLLLAAFISLSFLYFCLFISVLFPLYFKFSFSKIYLFANLPFYLIGVATITILRKKDLFDSLSQVVKYYTENQYMIWVTGIGAGLILIITSALISSMIYKRREL